MHFIAFLCFFLITFILREYFLVLQLKGVFLRQVKDGALVRKSYLYPGCDEDSIYLKIGLKKRSIIYPSKINEGCIRPQEVTDIKKFLVFVLSMIHHLVKLFYFANFSFLNLFLPKDISRSVLYFIRWSQVKISDIILRKIYKINHPNLVLI